MKALSLWQPWAGFVALGKKRVETRSWGTAYRGPLAIHAAKRWTRDEQDDACFLLSFAFGNPANFDFDEALHAVTSEANRGAVVALADVVDCREMDRAWCDEQTALELEMGDWKPGRFGWVLDNVRALSEPYPLTGRQGLWRVGEAEAKSIRLLAGLP